MAYLVALDDGHGMNTAGKRTPPIDELGGRVIRENEFNKAVKHYLQAELQRCGFKTLLVAEGDEDVPLATRVSRANKAKADAYISIHYNAFDGKFTGNDPEGHSLHIFPKSIEGRRLAECILKYLVQGTPQKNRGIRENNFHVLRQTNMPAVLSENGFMDSKREALLMVNTDFQKEVAREHAQGICDYFKVKYVDEEVKLPKAKELFRIQTGAFQNSDNAREWGEHVSSLGEDVYLVEAGGYYKVQVGAYGVRKNAENKARELRAKGLPVYITTERGNPVTLTKSQPKVEKPFLVQITASGLNVRTRPDVKSKIVTTIRDKGVYTITETKDGWGKLKSNLGWINLSHTKRV